MQWQRSARPPHPHPRQPSIPDTEAVRQAVLQASWRRDRRVAQRRIVWRWVLWFTQRYAPAVLALLALLVLGAYLAGWLPAMPWLGDHATKAVAAAQEPPVAPTDPSAEASDTPLTLRVSTRSEPRGAAAATAGEALTSADTLTLTPENWLHSKEP